MSGIHIPSDATVRLLHEAGLWIVAVTRPGAPPSPAAVANPKARGMCVQLNHAPGLSWPDAKNAALAETVLAGEKGAAFFAFHKKADA